MEQPKKLSPAIAAVIIIVLVGIVATVTIVIHNNSQTNTPGSSTFDPNATYKDGTYSATGSYSTPNGRESIELTVTITNNVITDTSLVENARSGEARDYQAEFASNYKDLVVGKKVNDVSLSRVAGSSLTSYGFNAALTQIKTDAKT